MSAHRSDSLISSQRAGDVEYDIESFIYVLVWVSSRDQDCELTPRARDNLEAWQGDNTRIIRTAHVQVLLDVTEAETQVYGEYTEVVKALCEELLRFSAEKVLGTVSDKLLGPFDHQYITVVRVRFEAKTETDEALKGTATRELDLATSTRKWTELERKGMIG